MRAALVGALLLCGCAQTMYRWGGYDDALYQHYKNPHDQEAFVTKLAVVITEAENAGLKVPPGCYAEYGWALYEAGRADRAAVYFEKEKKAWPESRFFMDKMIRNVSRAPAGPPQGTQLGTPP
jgi:hypothetical protein